MLLCGGECPWVCECHIVYECGWEMYVHVCVYIYVCMSACNIYIWGGGVGGGVYV